MRLETMGMAPMSFDEALCGFVARSSVLERLLARGAIGRERYAAELGELSASLRRSAERFGAERLPVVTRLTGRLNGAA